MLINVDWQQIRTELESVDRGFKGAVFEQYASMYGVSASTLRRHFSKKFGKKKVKPRTNKVKSALVDRVAKMKECGKRMSNAKNMEVSTEICINSLRQKGLTGADKLTKSTVNRILVQKGYREPPAKVRVEASYVNQEHQLDFSRSKFFQIFDYDRKAQDYLLKISAKELHYKQDDRRLRNWICMVKDSKSRMRIARAYAATSESGLIGMDTLNFLWNREPDSNPMRHLPDRLKTDNGAFSKLTETKEMLRALDIKSKLSEPYNHDSQGKVESGFASLWRCFELKYAIEKGPGYTLYLSEYNELLHYFMSVTDAQKYHPILKGQTREEVYREGILKHQPRKIDIDIMEIACRVKECMVTDSLKIRYGGEEYQAPVYAIDKKVRVYKNMRGELIGEMIDEYRKTFKLSTFKSREIDDFTNRPHQRYLQKIGLLAEKENSEKLSDNKKRARRVFMKPKAIKTVPTSPFVEREQKMIEFPNPYTAKAYIGKRLRCYNLTYEDVKDIFDSILVKDLSKKTINKMIDEVIFEVEKAIAL